MNFWQYGKQVLRWILWMDTSFKYPTTGTVVEEESKAPEPKKKRVRKPKMDEANTKRKGTGSAQSPRQAGPAGAQTVGKAGPGGGKGIDGLTPVPVNSKRGQAKTGSSGVKKGSTGPTTSSNRTGTVRKSK